MSETSVAKKPDRWDLPFSEELPSPNERRPMGESDVDRLLAMWPFADMDPENFPDRLPLRDILKYDTRLRHYEHGDVIVREGDYGNSAFLILSGRARVYPPGGIDPETLGRRRARRKPWWRSLIELATNPRSPEARDPREYPSFGGQPVPSMDWSGVQDVTNLLRAEPGAFERSMRIMPEGELFGELAALGRVPRTVTVAADGPTELLEIRWQGLRELRRYDDALRRYVDDRYRRYGLAATLQGSPLLAHLSDEEASRVAAEAVFETYGSYNWYGSYQQLRERDVDPLKKEPVIAQEGDYPNGLLLIRAGFARLSRVHGHGEQTVSYLRKGDVYGLPELAHNARHEHEPSGLLSTLRAIGYVDVVRVPTRPFEELILPGMEKRVVDGLVEAVDAERAPAESETDRRVHVSLPVLPNAGEATRGGAGEKIDPGMMEFLVENRFINGTAAMVIDMDRCTRCDDCVRACAAGHENNPVFVRHGPQYGKHMFATACMHCMDPVCMIGCPTGAIHRNEETGEVQINDATCIGCAVCASSCPYDAIRMVEVRDRTNDDAIMVTDDGAAVQKATKCDLCSDHEGGPACERACPHDALKRVDMRDLASFARWLNR